MKSLQPLVTAFALLYFELMKHLIYSFLSLIFVTSNAFAYSEETHKYETDIMLSYSGIHPAVAEVLSNYAQHVDDSRLNSALNPFPIFHMRISRLLHFPTEGVDPAEALLLKLKKREDTSNGHGDIQNIFGAAKRDSMIANEIFNEALKTGNVYLMGAALHVLMDSYAHEGFEYVIGHGARGHYPDRPWMFVEKHNEMRKLLFKAMTRIREVLPKEALSEIKVNKFGKLNRELTGQELFDSYSSEELVKTATAVNPHKDPLYTAEALSLVINQMIDQGIAKPELLEYLSARRELFFGVDKETGERKDGWEITKELVTELLALPEEKQSLLLNKEKFLARYGAVVGEDLTFVGADGKEFTVKRERLLKADDGSQRKLVEDITYSLISRIIPKPAAGDHENASATKFTMEDERLVSREGRIQRARWQEVRLKLLGLAPTLMIKRGDRKKLDKEIAQAALGGDGERLENDLNQLDKNIAQNQIFTQLTLKERLKFTLALFKYTLWDFIVHRATSPLVKMKLMKKAKGNTRLTNSDVKDAKAWQSREVFNELREKGVFKMILNPEQAQQIITKWEAKQIEFTKTLDAMKSGEKLTPLGQIEKARENYKFGTCRDIFSN